MNPAIQNALYLALSYVLICVIFYATINFLSKGWLTTYLKVKSSRGKKVFVEVDAVADTYFRVGYFKEDVFHYKTRHKVDKILTDIKHEDILHKLGVACVHVDEATDAVVRRNGSVKSGISAVNADQLVKRVILAAQIKKNIIMIILVLICVLLLLNIFGIILDYQNSKMLKEMLPVVHNLPTLLQGMQKGVVP